MQLTLNQNGSALLWVMAIASVVSVVGYLGVQTQVNSAKSAARIQASLDLAVLRSSLVQIVKDPIYCPLMLGYASNNSTPSIAPGTVTLTQIKVGTQPSSVVIATKPSATMFNTLLIKSIQLTNLTATGNPNEYSGNLHVDVTMPAQAIGYRYASIADIPMTIVSSPLACTGGP